MDAPLALPAPRLGTRIRWWARRAPARLAEALPRIALSTVLLSGLFWAGYLTGAGTIESSALPLTFLHPDGPPAWVRDFSSAFCRRDAAFVGAHLGGKFTGLDGGAVQEQFDSMRVNSGECVGSRYLGALTAWDGARQYVYVFDFLTVGERNSVWFVFTTLADRVVDIE